MAVIDENWNYCIDIKYDNHHKFESRLASTKNDVLRLSAFNVQNYEDSGQNQDDALKVLIEKNKQIRSNIDLKLEQISRQRTKYENFKEDQKLLSQEVKDTYEAFLMAKKYYKKFLKIYYTIESKDDKVQTIFLQFFTEAKKECENYSCRLLRDTKTEKYELLEVNPKLSTFEDLKKYLQEINDIPSILCSIREEFLKMKKVKKP